MSYRKAAYHQKTEEHGFGMVELMIVMALTVVVSIAFYTFFKANFFSYLNLQIEASNMTELAAKSHRMGNVLRGLTDIDAASGDEMTMYAYFYPTDTYVSLVRYYKNPAGTELRADVTQMTANPPIGAPIPESLKTHVIMSNFKQSSGTTLFEYLDSSGDTLTLPLVDLNIVKGIRVNLGVESVNVHTNQAMMLEVNLRNRKTNL